ncbi:MAG: glycosyltransferase, partial [Deltaproteobacteria bacterium]|nr:glycosyltransferase [Deltaproteobacteria bacterium]
MMNNDVVVTPGWLGRLITCAERDQKIGIVGPMTNYVPGQQWVKEVTYNTTSLARLNKFSREFAGKYSGQRKHVLRVVGFCMLLKRAVIDKIGGMDDRYGLGNFEDDDFSLRATLGGFESWIAEDCFIHHFGSRTFIGSGIDYKESLSKNWEIFKHKWGMPQDIPYGSYNLSQIGRQSFDHERDYLPLVDKDTLAKDGQAVAAPQVESEIGRSDENQPTNVDNSVEASIIISTSNQQKYLKRCIESIKKHTDEPHEVVFVDDGNAKGVLKWLRPIVKEKANYQLIKVDKNAGPAKCYNEGIGASSGKYILFLHNDVIVSDSWLSGMLGCLKRDSDIGIVSPMTHGTDGNRKNVAGDYPSVDNFDEYAKAFNKRNRHRQIPTKNVPEYCFACKRNLIEKVGFFDEKVDSEKVAVEDFCMRANIEGYRNVIASDIIVHHYDSHKVTKRKKHGEIVGDRKLLLEKRRDMAANPVLGKRLLTLSAIEQADELWQKDDIKGAFSVLAESIKKVPDEKGMYYALSKILIDAKQFKDALEVLNMMPPDDREVRKIELIGYCKEGMELYGETEEYAESAFAIDPGSALTLNLKGMVAYRQGDEKAAEAFFKMAVESNPGYGEPYANLGFMKWSAQQEDEAMDLFEKAFILTPTITDIFTNYHAAVKALGKYERAEQYFKDACNLYPKNKRLKFLLIDVLIQQEKHSMAMDEIQEAMIEFGMDEGMIAAALAVRNKLGPREIKSSSKNATISLCMIVKNEEQYLGKCLMNLNSVVDEMIVVDTGSTDGTKEIAAIFGARVYDVEWTNDFSEARNYSISKASGDWIFVMDADETISPIDHEALRKLAEKRSSRPAAYSFVTRNYNMRTDIIGLNTNDGRYGDEEAGVGWVSSEKVRLFRNDGRIRFEYPVHEMVEPSLRQAGIEIKRCSIPIHHYGQLNPDIRTCKGEEYYQMGIKKLNEMGDHVNAIYELAVQAGMLEKWEEAIDLWQRLIALRPHVPVAFVNMGTAFQKIGKFDEAIQSVERAMALDSDMKEAPNDYALYNLYSGHAGRAVPVLEDLVKKYPDYLSARFKLATTYTCVGRKKEGLDVLNKLSLTAMGPGL